MSTGGIVGLAIGLFIAGLIIGILIGFAIGQKMFKKQLRDNPPMSREQIKQLYRQMGRTLSEAQINQMMEEFKKKNK